MFGDLNDISSLVPRRKILLALKLQSKQRNQAESPIYMPRDMTSMRDHVRGNGLAEPERDNPKRYKVAKQNNKEKKRGWMEKQKLNKGFPNSRKIQECFD